MSTESNKYPSLDYTSDMLVRYLATAGIFTILLRNGEVINFEPADTNDFENWLQKHKIENLRAKGWPSGIKLN